MRCMWDYPPSSASTAPAGRSGPSDRSATSSGSPFSPLPASARPPTSRAASSGLALSARAQGVHVLIDLVPEQIPWVFSSIVVRREDIARRRDVLLRFLRGTIEGNYLALTDEKRAKEVLAKELKIGDPKILDITYNDFKA